MKKKVAVATMFAMIGMVLMPNGSHAASSLIGDLQGTGGPNHLNAARTMVKEGNTVFVIAQDDAPYYSTDAYFNIIDASDPTNPITRSYVQGLYSHSQHEEFVVEDGFAYIPDYQHFTIIDVNDLDNPVIRSRTSSGRSTIINQLVKLGNYVYIPIFGGSSGNHIDVWDVSNPDNPQRVTAGADIPEMAHCRNIATDGTHLYMACGNPSNSENLRIFSLSDPLNPTLVGTGVFGLTTAVDVKVPGDGYAYVVTRIGAIGLVIFDVSNPANPVVVGDLTGTYPDFPIPVYYAEELTVEGDYVYISSLDYDAGTAIVYVGNRSAPSFVEFVDSSTLTSIGPTDIEVSGSMLYALHPSGVLAIYDLDLPQPPPSCDDPPIIIVDDDTQVTLDANGTGRTYWVDLDDGSYLPCGSFNSYGLNANGQTIEDADQANVYLDWTCDDLGSVQVTVSACTEGGCGSGVSSVTIRDIGGYCVTDQDDDGVVDELDHCPTTPGLAERAGCPYGDFLSFTVQTIGQGKPTFEPRQGVEMKVFDADVVGNPQPNRQGEVFDSDNGFVGSCSTNTDGVCVVGEMEIKDYVVVAKYTDSNPSGVVYLSGKKTESDFYDGEAYLDLKLIKRFGKDGFERYLPEGQVETASSDTPWLYATLAAVLGFGFALVISERGKKKA